MNGRNGVSLNSEAWPTFDTGGEPFGTACSNTGQKLKDHASNRLSFTLAARHQAHALYQQADVTLFTNIIEQEAFGWFHWRQWRVGAPSFPPVSGIHQPLFDGPGCDLCSRGKAQLPQDSIHMPFGGSFADHQELCHLPACFALGYESRDFAFACC